MRKLTRSSVVVVAGALACSLGGSFFAPGAGAAAGRGATAVRSGHPAAARALVDTRRIVGFPQHARPASVGAGARTGGLGVLGPKSRRGTPPAITSQPQSDSVTAGSTASFRASASGSPAPSVQWKVATSPTSPFTPIRGATSTTYSFTAQSSQNGYRYEATFTNPAGSATTSAATLTVTAAQPTPPTITSQPSSDTVAAGSTATFSASATGSPAPTVQWQVSTNGGSSYSPVSGATSTTYSFTASASQNGDEFEAVFTNNSGTATTNPATLTVTTALVQSSNWSGYADTSGTFSAVGGTWSVPSVSCPSGSTSYSSEWIGIDGYSSNTVEQDGTEADCVSGSPSYDAWYEMYGDNAVNSGYEVELSPSAYPVSPGDSITASVNVSGSTWTLALTDTSARVQRWTFSTVVSYSGAARSSAEWIVERPEICSVRCSLASLADFGSVTISAASATTTSGTGSISATAYTGLEMVNGSTVLAVPGALDTAGDSFTDTWQHS